MLKKLIVSFGFLIAFIGLASFQTAQAADEEVIMLPGSDTLVEKDVKAAKKTREQVMQDVADHPELYQDAKEVTFETFAALPYSFNFDFKYNVNTGNFSNLKYPNLKLTMDVKTSSASTVYAALYDGNGKLKGTRGFATGKKSTANYLSVGMGNYNIYLYNSSDNGVRTYGSGLVTGY
ncbi:hypothetical protein ACQJ0Y_14455 [Peribacillus simplex]|uniref:hypothetical protein n=1 Tax=Peribacillus simplex TaxID=1478 RepID=UPI003CF6D318